MVIVSANSGFVLKYGLNGNINKWVRYTTSNHCTTFFLFFFFTFTMHPIHDDLDRKTSTFKNEQVSVAINCLRVIPEFFVHRYRKSNF